MQFLLPHMLGIISAQILCSELSGAAIGLHFAWSQFVVPISRDLLVLSFYSIQSSLRIGGCARQALFWPGHSSISQVVLIYYGTGLFVLFWDDKC